MQWLRNRVLQLDIEGNFRPITNNISYEKQKNY